MPATIIHRVRVPKTFLRVHFARERRTGCAIVERETCARNAPISLAANLLLELHSTSVVQFPIPYRPW